MSLPPVVKTRLFHSYCTSYYGCVLWDLSCSAVDDFCIAWKKNIRRIFNLPYQTRSYLLPLLCDCLPVYDELCLRFVNFVHSCMAHQSHLVSFIARYSTMHGRFSSPVGCAQRYASTVEEDLLFRGQVRSVVASCVGLRKSFTDEQFQIAYLLQECVMVRDGLAKLHECEKYIYYIYYILLLFGHVNSDESCLSNMLCFICHF